MLLSTHPVADHPGADADMSQPSSITHLLIDWSNGNPSALEELTPQVQKELHALAQTYLRRGRPNQTLQPTALINELYLRLIDQSQSVHWECRSHFFGIAARLMRQILVDYARAHYAAKRGGDDVVVPLDEVLIVSRDRPPDVLELDEALDRLAEVDERKCRIVELRYFGGMSREEIAAACGLTLPTVKRDLRLAIAWLRRDLSHEH
jgi:RNA polymerase sigma-70 factor, ECF subfamily